MFVSSHTTNLSSPHRHAPTIDSTNNLVLRRTRCGKDDDNNPAILFLHLMHLEIKPNMGRRWPMNDSNDEPIALIVAGCRAARKAGRELKKVS
jgi:hypothetical protein